MSFSIKECTDSPKNRNLQRQAVLHSFNKKEDKTQTLLAHTDSFASLPLYKTPPSVVKTRKPFNPFNRNLMERLESTTFSPTVFKTVISPGEVSSSEFRWTIEDVSRINPVNIEEFVHHDDTDAVDNETEQSAQEAIERYFSKVEIPSPWDAPRHCSSPLTETPEILSKSKLYNSVSSVSTGNKHFQVSSSPCLTVNVGTQTCWSFPPVLPEHVEAILKPYLFPITNEFETEEGNLSASTRRRKLNFSKGHDSERSESDDESMSCNKFSLDGGFCSPVSHLTGTPLPMSILSPPDVSPILASTNSQSKLTARLNFTSNNNEKEENDEIASIMVTSLCNNSSKDNEHHNTQMKNDSNQQTVESSTSQDTGYNTQSSNDKTGWGGTIGVSEMEITDNISWNDPVVYACSTPTKGKPFLVC